MIILKLIGVYQNEGKILLDTGKTFEWSKLSSEKPTKLLSGSGIELSISFDDSVFLSGNNRIVWAIYDLRPAEIIQNSLIARDINSEVKKNDLMGNIFFLIKNTNETDVLDSINFVWKYESGLWLKPDWSYPVGETNKSFEIRLSWY